MVFGLVNNSLRYIGIIWYRAKTQNPVNQLIYRVLILRGIAFCRDGRIRTCGLHIPNVARYRATLHPVPDWVCKSRILNQVAKLFLKEFSS